MSRTTALSRSSIAWRSSCPSIGIHHFSPSMPVYTAKTVQNCLRKSLHQNQPMLGTQTNTLTGVQTVQSVMMCLVGAVAAGWLTDRLYEAGAEPTATSSVAMQATPLVIAVGAFFFGGAAGAQVKQSRTVLQVCSENPPTPQPGELPSDSHALLMSAVVLLLLLLPHVLLPCFLHLPKSGTVASCPSSCCQAGLDPLPLLSDQVNIILPPRVFDFLA